MRRSIQLVKIELCNSSVLHRNSKNAHESIRSLNLSLLLEDIMLNRDGKISYSSNTSLITAVQ